MSRKDFTLLFENEEMKNYLPVESVSNINVYGNIVLSPSILGFLNGKRISVYFFDDNMNYIGNFEPATGVHDAGILLKQASIYNDKKLRLKYAYEFEYASIRNMMAVIRYYARRLDNNTLRDKAAEIKKHPS